MDAVQGSGKERRKITRRQEKWNEGQREKRTQRKCKEKRRGAKKQRRRKAKKKSGTKNVGKGHKRRTLTAERKALTMQRAGKSWITTVEDIEKTLGRRV
jgi:hypothetical protein